MTFGRSLAPLARAAVPGSRKSLENRSAWQRRQSDTWIGT